MANIQGSLYEQLVNTVAQQINSQNLRQITYHILHNIDCIPTCSCGKNLSWMQTRYLKYCSPTCSTNSTKQTRAETNLKKYGVSNFAKTNDFKIKSKATFLKKYGVDNPSKSSQIQEKKINTNISKYGVLNHSQKHLSSTSYEIISDKDKFIEFVKNKTITEVAEELGLSPSGPIKIAERFGLNDIFLSTTRSKYEDMIDNLLQFTGINYVKNTKKIISPLQLDFYIPTKNLAIEVGSMYFHCEKSSQRGRNYHYQKWQACNSQGITLLQYFDDDLLEKWPIVESKIKRLCGISLPVIGARKTTIKINEINTKIEKDFLTKFHLQGPNICRTHVVSAHVNDKLIGVLSIKIKNFSAEVIRFAVENSNSYPGLFSKMLKKFLDHTNFTGTIYSFSDNRHSNGQLYRAAGFTLEKITKPGYSYTKNYLSRLNRINYQKHKLIKKFNLPSEQSLLSEWAIMQNFGYDRLWDAGQSKWILKV